MTCPRSQDPEKLGQNLPPDLSLVLGPFNCATLFMRLNLTLCPFSFYWETTVKTVSLTYLLNWLILSESNLSPKSSYFVTFPEFHSPGARGKSVLPQPPAQFPWEFFYLYSCQCHYECTKAHI